MNLFTNQKYSHRYRKQKLCGYQEESVGGGDVTGRLGLTYTHCYV